jgi:hypothetical protein
MRLLLTFLAAISPAFAAQFCFQETVAYGTPETTNSYTVPTGDQMDGYNVHWETDLNHTVLVSLYVNNTFIFQDQFSPCECGTDYINYVASQGQTVHFVVECVDCEFSIGVASCDVWVYSGPSECAPDCEENFK